MYRFDGQDEYKGDHVGRSGGDSDVQICADEIRAGGTAADAVDDATASPQKRIVDAMFASSRRDTPPASPRTRTTTTTTPMVSSGHRIGAAGGLFSGSVLRYGGQRTEGSRDGDGSPSRGLGNRDVGTRVERDMEASGYTRPELTMTSTVDTSIAATAAAATEEQGNLDDTCFTAFSEIPNAEVTQYTKMPTGSPFKGFREDHVSCKYFS